MQERFGPLESLFEICYCFWFASQQLAASPYAQVAASSIGKTCSKHIIPGQTDPSLVSGMSHPPLY